MLLSTAQSYPPTLSHSIRYLLTSVTATCAPDAPPTAFPRCCRCAPPIPIPTQATSAPCPRRCPRCPPAAVPAAVSLRAAPLLPLGTYPTLALLRFVRCPATGRPLVAQHVDTVSRRAYLLSLGPAARWASRTAAKAVLTDV